jgi:2-keto-4-pentenoate hydratase
VDDIAINDAARIVADHRLSGAPLPALPGLTPGEVDEGYRVLQAANGLLRPHLGPVRGYKIGATAQHMQRYLGVTEPVFGEIFESTIRSSPVSVRLGQYRRLGIETEIAVTLQPDLPPLTMLHDRRSIAEYVASVHAAIELVDNRYADFGTVGAATLAADNFFGTGLALGPAHRLDDIGPLDLLMARTLLDGQERASGCSGALLGHPLEALAWFINCRTRLGLPLQAGSIVTLGSITPVFWIDQPASARIEIDLLGVVEVDLLA